MPRVIDKPNILKRGFSLNEAAQYCGIPVKTIYEAKRRRSTKEARDRFPVPGVKRGKTWLFDRKDLDAWLDDVFKDKK
jgi:predicted DNA-binding transcriptional regulator AlpA